jgi:hypothetical protein
MERSKKERYSVGGFSAAAVAAASSVGPSLARSLGFLTWTYER